MKYKIYSMALACALLLTLAACQKAPAESPSLTPTPSPSAEATPTPEPTPAPVADDGTRYFFADSYFLGAWADGAWRSCDSGRFTVGEIFNRDYYDAWGETLNAARFYVGEGPGEFEDPQTVARLLEPFGILEGDDLVFKLPGQFTGEAAQVNVPAYNFYVSFEGQPHYFVSNAVIPEPEWHTADGFLPDGAAAQALETIGITYDLSKLEHTAWTCDIDGDGEEEILELIQTLRDDNGYAILARGEQCFYAFLLQDGDRVEPVASRVNDPEFGDDVTTHFAADTPQFRDLDGDGVCEIIFQEHCWEWGYYYAFSRTDGAWKQVLCSSYGM